MNVTKNTDDYDNITSSNNDNITPVNYTDTLNVYYNLTISNRTNNGNNIDIIIPTLLLLIPSGLSFVCLMGLRIYTLIKPLSNNK